MDDRISDYFDKQPKYKSALQRLREIILKTEIAETVKWEMPVYTINNKNVIGIGAFKEHFGVWFFQGALLKDLAGKLTNAQEGKTKAMRHWRFTKEEQIEERLLLDYLEEAIANQKAGKTIKAKKPEKKIHVIPPEWKKQLTKSPQLEKSFYALTPGKQNEYMEYITIAKRASTKQSRIEKIIPMILHGKGLNDKYK